LRNADYEVEKKCFGMIVYTKKLSFF